MKKVAQIMEELGFRPGGSDEVKKAFIKNLIREANLQEGRQEKPQKPKVRKMEQLDLFSQKKSG